MGGREGQRGLTIAGLIKAMSRVAVRGEDGDFVSAFLQRDCGIDNEPLGAANAEIRVEEDGVLLLLRHVCSVESLQRVVDMRRCLRHAVPQVLRAGPTIPLLAVAAEACFTSER